MFIFCGDCLKYVWVGDHDDGIGICEECGKIFCVYPDSEDYEAV